MKKLSLLFAFIMSISLMASCQAPEITDESVAVIDFTATQMAEEMGLGISLGNTLEAYDAKDCETIEFEWIPTVGDNTPKDYETVWGGQR